MKAVSRRSATIPTWAPLCIALFGGCDSGTAVAPSGMANLPVAPAGSPSTAGAPANVPAAAARAGAGVLPSAAGTTATGSAIAGASPSGAAGASAAPAAGSGGMLQAAAGSGMPLNAGQGGSAAVDPADADIETCYELRAHGQPSPGDKTSYMVPAGETYTGFVVRAPWTKPVQGLRFRHLPDNKAVLHHWLLYAENGPASDGDIDPCQLDGPTGFLCGQASTRTLITGWAPGRGDFRLPTGVGLELPAPGAMLAVEFHYFNLAGAAAQDHSGVEVCVTSKFRPNTASISWLGTQQIDIPAGMTGTASGTCRPLRSGMNSTDPIHVIFSWPHMHKLGTHMKSVVKHAAGAEEMMYDGPFNFDSQVLHETPVLLQPGDSVTTTCTFQNTTAAAVGFGQSTQQEMCYNFTYAWPAHALDNPGAEIGGASNTCLH
jgi:hypothetical protein